MARSSLRESLTSVTIAFAYAFVFRAFVIEAFVIPTGSMAPTLLGQHARVRSASTGYEWAIGPWQDSNSSVFTQVKVNDPFLGTEQEFPELRRLSGDRILVLKYLPPLFSPERFDVVVFKSPETPQVNFIKRLLALPGEQVALADGDVFTRAGGGEAPSDDAWARPGWTIQRKPDRVQQAVWQPYDDSRYAPLTSVTLRGKSSWTFSPGWEANPVEDGKARAILRYAGASPASVTWKAEDALIWDHYPYNQVRPVMGDDAYRGRYANQSEKFPVSDLRVVLDAEIPGPGFGASMVLTARGHEFRADLSGSRVTLRMRPEPAASQAEPEWNILLEADHGRRLGSSVSIEFWHVDQTLQVWIDGSRAARAEYDWGPQRRIELAIGEPMADILAQNLISRGARYRAPKLAVEFSGGPLTLHRLRLDRDLHYQPGVYRYNGRGQRHSLADKPWAATHPRSTLSLSPTQFFTCGDNSPASSDARQWDTPDPWVAATIDPSLSVVPADLMTGKAFFVYFPSMHYEHWFSSDRAAIPDFGRMRWIW